MTFSSLKREEENARVDYDAAIECGYEYPSFLSNPFKNIKRSAYWLFFVRFDADLYEN